MKSLVEKGMQYSGDCLRCHTVGFKQPGGFSDLRVTPGLANVQCEVCHGPAQKHVEEQQQLALAAGTQAGKGTSGTVHLLMKWDEEFCAQCHDSNNDPRFNFAEALPRVRHKSPAPPRAKETTATATL
jgi:hypothetical protein